jgi:hypothetical protein
MSSKIKGIYLDKKGYYHAQVNKSKVRFRKTFKTLEEAVHYFKVVKTQLGV